MRYKAVVGSLVVVVLVAGAIYMRGRPASVAKVTGNPRQVAVGAAGLFWIEAPAPDQEGPVRLLHLAHGGKQPSVLLQAHDIRSVAVTDTSLYVLSETGPEEDSGLMSCVDLSTGSTRLSEAGLHRPQGLAVDGGNVYWTESRSARAEAMVHVPIMKPVNAIRVGPRPSEGKLVGLTEGSEPHFTGQLAGVRQGQLYWSEHLGWEFVGGATLIKRGGGAGKDPELLGRAVGQNVAALDGDRLYWTAYSQEMERPSAGRVVQRMDLGSSSVDTITDWLSGGGALVCCRGTAYYVGGGRLWRVPPRLDPPVPMARLTVGATPVAAVYRDNLYCAASRGGKMQLWRIPLSWRGYLSAVLRAGGAAAKVGPVAVGSPLGRQNPPDAPAPTSTPAGVGGGAR